MFEEPEDPTNRSFFSEIISSISDVKFSNSGRYMISRDYLSVKVWDLHMETKPIETYTVNTLKNPFNWYHFHRHRNIFFLFSFGLRFSIVCVFDLIFSPELIIKMHFPSSFTYLIQCMFPLWQVPYIDSIFWRKKNIFDYFMHRYYA